MKLINIIFSFLLFLLSLESFGQQARIVDLRVTIISPLKNDYIKSPGTVLVKFSVFNKGPGVIKPADTIRFYPRSNDTLFKVKKVYSSKTIQVGDSEIFNVDIPFNSPVDNNYYILGIASLVAIL